MEFVSEVISVGASLDADFISELGNKIVELTKFYFQSSICFCITMFLVILYFDRKNRKQSRSNQSN